MEQECNLAGEHGDCEHGRHIESLASTASTVEYSASTASTVDTVSTASIVGAWDCERSRADGWEC